MEKRESSSKSVDRGDLASPAPLASPQPPVPQRMWGHSDQALSREVENTLGHRFNINNGSVSYAVPSENCQITCLHH
ncbi:conserved hypothetical protein [Ricinus communis]|uniref:Uncharacterized protein n=1 Tax=Ricinus communis TaxID=3988 RepID=B9RSS6_RICCO|nr:conserved hypothetical protein [Ricinus communis]